MIKLKNLWKIALATMTMSAMLVACDTTSDDGKKDDSKGTTYSYTVNIDDISDAWGGSITSPAFSVVLLSDANKDLVIEKANLKVSPITDPEYQIAAFDNMKIADKIEAGDYAVYGKAAVNDEYQYYAGVAATITDTTLTVTVDMTKLVKTQLKALWEGDKECVVGPEADFTEEDVDLTGYKPYIIALASKANDEANFIVNAWNADLMAMEEGATLPTNLKKAAPVVSTCEDLNSYAGTMTGANWPHLALTDNTFTFTAAGDDAFAFTIGSWDFNARGVEVTELDKEFKLVENVETNITFKAGVLTAGTEYTATLIVKGKHEAYVKVSAK